MYPYTEVNRFEEPNTYMYTPFSGAEFINAYFENRKQAISFLNDIDRDKVSSEIHENDHSDTGSELRAILGLFGQGDYQTAYDKLEDYLRRFEVAKRLRNNYPVVDNEDLASLSTHLIFFEILIRAYSISKDIRYINVMLKLGDTVVSIKDKITSHSDIELVTYLLEREMSLIDQLRTELAVEI